MSVLYILRCDSCDRMTPAFITEERLWAHAHDGNWTQDGLGHDRCVDCSKGAA